MGRTRQGTSKTASLNPRKFSSGITNGRIHTSDDETDDEGPGPSRSMYSRRRPKRGMADSEDSFR